MNVDFIPAALSRYPQLTPQEFRLFKVCRMVATLLLTVSGLAVCLLGMKYFKTVNTPSWKANPAVCHQHIATQNELQTALEYAADVEKVQRGIRRLAGLGAAMVFNPAQDAAASQLKIECEAGREKSVTLVLLAPADRALPSAAVMLSAIQAAIDGMTDYQISFKQKDSRRVNLGADTEEKQQITYVSALEAKP